ncbi:hypothetical protein LCGC14_3053230, partial [marine sediment metagenome]
MRKQKYSHTAKHFFHRKAIIENYDSTNKLLHRIEFDIEPERRFIFHGLELDQLYVSYWEEYEIIIYEPFCIKEINGKNFYVSEKTNKPIPQAELDLEVIRKLNRLPISSIPKFLSYQLKKYLDKKVQLKSWRELIEINTNFVEPINNWHNVDAQQIALTWVKSRIRKSNLRTYQSDKDISLENLFRSPELLDSVLTRLAEKHFINYNHFLGRFEWLKKGQDLAVLGELLQQYSFYKGWVDYPVRHNALTKFFNVRGKKGFSDRTFRKST